MLSVNGRDRVELLLVRGKNAVLSRENYLPLAAHLKLLFPGKFQLCFQCTFPSGFFTVAPKIFNKSLKK